MAIFYYLAVVSSLRTDWMPLVIFAVPVIYFAGQQTQILKQLRRIVDDHEKRIRKGGM